jgi:amino acid permease
MSSVSASGGRRTGPLVLAVILVIIAILAIIVGVIYLTKTSESLPSFLPGRRQGNTGHDSLRAIGAFVVAVIALIGAWIAVRGGHKSAVPPA